MSHHKDVVNFGPQEANRMTLMDTPNFRREFRDRSDATIITYWNQHDGSLSFLIAVEEELRARGYQTREPGTGNVRVIPIPGNK